MRIFLVLTTLLGCEKDLGYVCRDRDGTTEFAFTLVKLSVGVPLLSTRVCLADYTRVL